MKGTNELKLNQATMMEAVEYWLTNKVIRGDISTPQVTQVAAESSHSTGFIVTLQEREQG